MGMMRQLIVGTVAFVERRRGQVPLYIYNEARHGVPGLYLLEKFEFSCIDYDLSLGSFSLILVRYTKVLIDSELPG